MRHLLWSALLISGVIFSGCGYKEGVKIEEKEAFLYFNGNTDGVSVSVDDAEHFSVKEGINNQYKVKSGKHTVRVFRDGKLIVLRELYLGDGMSVGIGVGK